MGINALPLPTREVFVNIQLPSKMDCNIAFVSCVWLVEGWHDVWGSVFS